MDPNLEKIIQANTYNIRHGNVRTSITQAQDYLNHMLLHNKTHVQTELDVFANHVKDLRKKSRGKRKTA